ncbi:polysaccharide biosynthesis C-terminal domain-containing protein [Lapidilactobacillus mulanensis]|uniref:Polysaccharide biosynthesis C-terminal domain-containing protein n=1 Tax=Lapidilactobacillus mulanensis TaxID=2485999 RepID=A0ABW4DKP8_9LACO|nr:polysaccharide biosynthesis protein [Lapidilactobacillus mulanensis]
MAKEPSGRQQRSSLQQSTNATNSQESLVRGSVWITAGSIFSRILGAVYIILWLPMIGDAQTGNLANALFSKGYNIYSIFLLISTAGIPGAIAKQVAHYNTLNEYRVSQRLFKTGVKLMVILGVVSAAIMFFAAPLYAQSAAEIPVYRSLSVAVLIIPFLSILRGYFQGFNQMAPSAISQFVEQLARIIYLLGATYLIMEVRHGQYTQAVVQSTFAAFIGAIFGILALGWFYWRQRHQFSQLLRDSNDDLHVSTRDLVKDIAQQSLPFILLGSGIAIFQLIDQYSFNQIMSQFVIASQKQLDIFFAIFNFNANKLIMIVISFASAMAVAAIPLLSAAHARNDQKDMSRQIANILQLFLIIMLPASFGVAAVAAPLYTVFYGYDSLGIHVLQVSAFMAIFLGLFTVLAAILQGLYQNRAAMIYLVIGIAVKLLLQYPLIAIFKIYGPLLSTAFGMLVTSALMINSLYELYHFKLEQTARRMLAILTFSIIMFIVTLAVVNLFGLFLPLERKIISAVVLFIAVAIGGGVYAFLILRTRLADRILGAKIGGLRRRLHIR